MEPILIYGFPAGSSMGLVAALEWLREPYRLCRVDMLGEMRDQAYAKLNPRHEDMAALMTEVRRLNPHIADINNIPAGRLIVLPGYGAGCVKAAPFKAAASRAPKPAVDTAQPAKAPAPAGASPSPHAS